MAEPKRSVDLNADVGEGFGPYSFGDDETLLTFVSSANIACGFHAGDPHLMRKTVALALRHQVAIGAHPGLPDREGFGRRKWEISAAETYEWVQYQIGALAGFARAAGTRVAHVKPHGALYNMAAEDPVIASAIAQAVFDVDPTLVLFGLAGSQLLVAGEACGLPVAREAFADRRYESNGGLTPRNFSEAVIKEPSAAAEQALAIVRTGGVLARTGERLALAADTICIHGDQPHAVAVARAVRQALADAGIDVAPFSNRFHTNGGSRAR